MNNCQTPVSRIAALMAVILFCFNTIPQTEITFSLYFEVASPK
jgi:hypothetical protein